MTLCAKTLLVMVTIGALVLKMTAADLGICRTESSGPLMWFLRKELSWTLRMIPTSFIAIAAGVVLSCDHYLYIYIYYDYDYDYYNDETLNISYYEMERHQ